MTKQENSVRELALAIFAGNGTLISTGNALVAHLGLTSAWWQVLGALRYSPVPLPTASIARNMGMSRQAVQRIVDLLAERGLVEFKDNPHHRRAKLIVLTQTGVEAVTAAEQAAAAIDKEVADRIGNTRLREAIQTLNEMNGILSAWLDRDAPSPVSDPNSSQET